MLHFVYCILPLSHRSLLLIISVAGAPDMTVLKANTPSEFGVTLTFSYFLRQVNICATSNGDSQCTSYTDTPTSEVLSPYYTHEFSRSCLAMEGLVATAAAFSVLMTLSLYVLKFTSARQLTGIHQSEVGSSCPRLATLR